MISAAVNYLQDCLGAFEQLSEMKYGSRFDLAAIERSVTHLRGERPLSYEDLQQFESPGQWDFEKFWVFPPAEHLNPVLMKRKFNFWQLPKQEKDVVTSLLDVFKSIELASIILRFIRPEYYGIISPPVERILDVRRGGDAVETYLNYVANLRDIQKHYGFERACDADMALWVLHERCYGTLRDARIEQAYNADDFLRRIRAQNVMGHFLHRYSYAELAHALVPVHVQLAAQMAGIAFERMVRNFAADPAPEDEDPKDLEAVIDDLYRTRAIDTLTHGRWHACRKIRNKAIHEATPVSESEAMRLIDALKEVTPAVR